MDPKDSDDDNELSKSVMDLAQNTPGLLQALRVQKKEDQERKIQEMKSVFPTLHEGVLTEILRENGWDVDKSYVPAFERLDRLKREQARREEQERVKELEKQKRDARAQTEAYLQDMFALVPKAQIMQLLDKHQGDAEATIIECEQIQAEKMKQSAEELAAKRAAAAKQQEIIERQCKIDNLTSGRFAGRVSRGEAEKALMDHDWNVEKAALALAQQAREAARRLNPQECGRAALDQLLRVSRVPVTKNLPTPPARVSNGLAVPAELAVAVPVVPPVVAVDDEDVAVAAEDEVKGGDSPLFDMSDLIDLPEATTRLATPPVLDPNSADGRGNSLSVGWSGSQEAQSHDWIGVYWLGLDPEEHPHSDQQSGQRVDWQWVSKGQKAENGTAGTVVFTTPTTFGVYECRYFTPENKTYRLEARSGLIWVGPQFDAKAVLQGDPAHSRRIAVSFEQVSGAEYPNAWVGLYEPGAADKQYKTHQYIDLKKQEPLLFDVPKTGEWEFRIFPFKSYVCAGRVNIVVGGQDELRVDVQDGKLTVHFKLRSVDPATESPWIGIYHQQESNMRQWRRYSSPLKPDQTECSFKAPIHTGDYEARLFARGTYTVIARSNVVHIDGQ